jgi:hypothetical protein
VRDLQSLCSCRDVKRRNSRDQRDPVLGTTVNEISPRSYCVGMGRSAGRSVQVRSGRSW